MKNRVLRLFAIATGTTLAIVAVSYSLYDTMILGNDMFGHLMPASTPSASSASATATPATKESCGASAGAIFGRRIREA